MVQQDPKLSPHDRAALAELLADDAGALKELLGQEIPQWQDFAGVKVAQGSVPPQRQDSALEPAAPRQQHYGRVVQELNARSGGQLDPRVVAALVSLIERASPAE